MAELSEGCWGFDAGALVYPRVSTCLTLSIINAGMIYGMHGVIVPEASQMNIAQLIGKLKTYKPMGLDAKLVVACDLGIWGATGSRFAENRGNVAGVRNFKDLADHLGISQSRVTLVDVGDGTPFFNRQSSSASFRVDITGAIRAS